MCSTVLFAICSVMWFCIAELETCKLQSAYCVMHYCSVEMAKCNLHCASYMILQCSIGDLQFTLWEFYYTSLLCNPDDLQFALCRLHYKVLHYGGVKGSRPSRTFTQGRLCMVKSHILREVTLSCRTQRI